jgi:isoquinoline 1-oxidoreductase subunit beta
LTKPRALHTSARRQRFESRVRAIARHQPAERQLAQVERQVLGSFVYGLSALFYGECSVKDGRIEQADFDTYNSMRISEMPKVETIVMPSRGFWGGVGEPTPSRHQRCSTRTFAATGKRIR